MIQISFQQGGIAYDSIETNKDLQDMPNVIYLIGDGMGPEQILAASLVEYGMENGSIMDTDFPIQYFYTTQSIDDKTTDSAASGTALATGQLTKNRIISMDQDKTIYYKSILEYLKFDFGYSTGIVTSMISTHATPAVFGAHNDNRDDFAGIGVQMFGKTIDLILGGGLTSPVTGPDATSAKQKGEGNGYDVATDLTELQNFAGTSNKLLGVFGGIDHVGYELDKVDLSVPNVYEMTEAALQFFQRKNSPYFVMIEGGLIDYAGHLDSTVANKTAYQIFQTIIFEKTVRYALEAAKADGNTIVIVAADHETGGFQVHDFVNLDNILPSPEKSEGENYNIRFTRSNQLNSSFLWNAHTPIPVRFYGYGSDFGGHIVTTNAEVFWAINKAVGSFPTVLNQTYIKTTGNLQVKMGIKDLDHTADKFGVFVTYTNGSVVEYNEDLLDVVEASYTMDITVDSSQSYSAYIRVYDNGIYDVISFDSNNNLIAQDITYLTPSTTMSSSSTTAQTSEKSDNSDSPIPFMISVSPIILVFIRRLRK